jgi:hypothetical protein
VHHPKLVDVVDMRESEDERWDEEGGPEGCWREEEERESSRAEENLFGYWAGYEVAVCREIIPKGADPTEPDPGAPVAFHDASLEKRAEEEDCG